MNDTVNNLLSSLMLLKADGGNGEIKLEGLQTGDWLRRQIDDFPGGAFVIVGDGSVLAANTNGLDLLDRLTDDGRKFLEQDLRLCLHSGVAVQGQIRAPGDEMELILDATFVPIPGADRNRVLVLTKDITLDYHFRHALVASRRLFKDLVKCSSDFAWETRADGTFSYVTQRGAIGYSAIDLDRSLARDLLVSQVGFGGAGTFNPFETREAVTDAEIQLRAKDGSVAVMRVSCVPVYSRDRKWLGARGVCRDISEVRARERALAAAQERERIAHDIISSIHGELLPWEMLLVATRVVSEEMETQDCWIVRAGTSGEVMVAGDRAKAIDFAEIAASGALDRPSASERWFEVETPTLNLLFVNCGHGTTTKGYLVLGKPLEFGPWSDEDHQLLADIGDHVGVVISQAEILNRLEDLSRTDELTELLNRRAFNEEVEIRLRHAARCGHSHALLYMDMDNFKAVNDQRGHAEGDFVLRTFAKMLRETSRAGDYVGRIGGDEFVMWLEEIDQAGAVGKAEAILQNFDDLKELSVSPEQPLGVSIGIAYMEGYDPVSLDELFTVADQAMYDVKRSGKSSVLVKTVSDHGVVPLK